MPLRSTTLLILLLGGALLVVVACGGSGQPATFNDLPLYPDAAEIQPGENEFADLMISLMVDTTDTEDTATEVMVFSAPDGTSWNQVFAYYANELRDTDWKDDNALNQSSEAASIAGWTRGSGAKEQALLVGHAVDPLSESPFIIVVLISEL